MRYLKGTCNTIVALILFFSIILPVAGSPVLINGTGIFLTTGDSWDFYQGYSLTVRSVNLEQKQVWVKLLQDDEILKERILSEGDVFVYSKNQEILNITVDTIYINPDGELVTFKPVYQYQDNELPEPVIVDEDNEGTDNGDLMNSENSSAEQAHGFPALQSIAYLSIMIAFRKVLFK